MFGGRRLKVADPCGVYRPEKKRWSIYLAHPIKDRIWIKDVEESLESELPVDFINPFYDRDREDINDIDNGRKKEFGAELDAKTIVMDDLSLIRKSNGILAVLTGSKTIGTIMELMYARIIGKKVWIVCLDKELMGHPWLRYVSDNNIYPSFEEWVNSVGSNFTEY